MEANDLDVTAAATFAATAVDEWARAGVQHAVVSPGSRSTPLALALVADERMRVHVHQDERAAAFTALGIGAASGSPAVVLTTSGTAAAELHPAVVEADLGRVPLIVCTADRPAELQRVGAPQTIDQTRLYGTAPRWFHDPGVPDQSVAEAWRSIASRAVAEATGSPAGPVHLNLPFRDPLVGSPGPLPPGRPARRPWHERLAAPRRIAHDDALHLVGRCRDRNGVIVAGTGIRHPEHVLLLAHTLGWPVFADPRSGCRLPDPAVVTHFDAITRSDDAPPPEVVIRLGMPPASKSLAQWVRRNAAVEIVVDRDGWWLDPGRNASFVVQADPCVACLELAPLLEDTSRSRTWLDTWSGLERRAEGALQRVVDDRDDLTEPAVARTVVRAAPEDATLVVASSMPIRDVEWYAPAREGLRMLANRGANGIDGTVSTAVGVAITEGTTVALVGDLAFLHDVNGLLSADARTVDLTVVVVDNAGGGIFSFLPQARSLAPDQFELLFGTPHGLDLETIAAAYGARAHHADDATQLAALLDKATGHGGVDVIVVHSNRDENVSVHDEIHEAVAAALVE